MHGSVAVVTGASSGIGRATAVRLARAGAHVVLAARNGTRVASLASELTAEGLSVSARATDVTKIDDLNALVEEVDDRHGRLDCLVNAAGVMSLGPSLSVPVEQWQAMIDTNVTGLVVLCKLALPLMLRSVSTNPRSVGDIINISSLAGRSSKAEHNVYNATKWAVIGFSGALRQEFAAEGVRVAVIEPGLTATGIFGKQPPARRPTSRGSRPTRRSSPPTMSPN